MSEEQLAERVLCSDPSGCFRFATEPPKDHVHNIPLCSFHLPWKDRFLYMKELGGHTSSKKGEGELLFCPGCKLMIFKDFLTEPYRTACCKKMFCGECDKDDVTCRACDAPLIVPEHQRDLPPFSLETRPRKTPVQWFLPWTCLWWFASKELKHYDSLTFFKPSYKSLVEACTRILENIQKEQETPKPDTEVYIRFKKELLLKNMDLYNDILTYLDIDKTFCPAFVPPIATFLPLTRDPDTGVFSFLPSEST